jgi:predicted RNA binding protein YcfA (HicA-like mRNA interferase family)
MSRQEKLIQKLTAIPTPSDVKWDELKAILKHLGYEMLNNKGSRRKFVHNKTKEIISLHEPHPQPEVKVYAIKQVVEQLKMSGKI